MIKVGVIGYGYWGPNLVRSLSQLSTASIEYVCDFIQERTKAIKEAYPSVKITSDYKDLLHDKGLEAVVIATPASSHYQLAKECLEHDKHILVEKPLATKASQCYDLIELSEQKGLVLMAGHTFEYNAAVNKLKEYIDSGQLGDIYYIYSSRLNLGKVRQDINAMWNLAPHDISIIQYLLGQEAIKVSASGFTYLQEGIEDVIFMLLDFPGNVKAHIHVSWLDPLKIRQMVVVGSKKMVVYDDVSPEAKIQVYDKGIDKNSISKTLGEFNSFGEFQLIQRAGDIYIPKIDFKEPLRIECSHFIECIKKGEKPLTDGKDGLRVVKVLEAAQRSLNEGGAIVEI